MVLDITFPLRCLDCVTIRVDGTFSMSVPFSFRYSVIKPEQYWENSKMYGKDNLWAEFWIIDTKLSSGKHFAGFQKTIIVKIIIKKLKKIVKIVKIKIVHWEAFCWILEKIIC